MTSWKEYVSNITSYGATRRELTSGLTERQIRDNATTLNKLKVFDYEYEQDHFCFSGVHASKRVRQVKTDSGIVHGNNQNNYYEQKSTRNAYFTGADNDERTRRPMQFHDSVAQLTNIVYSRHDWLLKCNIRYGIPFVDASAANNPGQSIAKALFTKGVDSPDSLCWESRKPAKKDKQTATQVTAALQGEGDAGRCQAVGNTIAMIFGLYYYAGCSNDLYQWTRYEKVGDAYYAIRFRCPNPHYGTSKWYTRDNVSPLDTDKRLRVYEKLNPLNEAFVRLFHLNSGSEFADAQKYVGGTYMRVPQIGKLKPLVMDPDKTQQQKLFSMWTALVNEQGKSLTVPYIGMFENKAHYHVYQSRNAPRYRQAGVMMHQAGIVSAHNPTGVADDAKTRPINLVSGFLRRCFSTLTTLALLQATLYQTMRPQSTPLT